MNKEKKENGVKSLPTEPIFCACGCGEKIKLKPYHKYYLPKFINGHNLKGKQFTEEHKRNISLAKRGKSTGKQSVETRKKSSASKKGQKNPMYGKHQSEETKRKLREVNKSRVISTVDSHYSEILKQTKILEEQGFRCIPLGKVIPDIIAIKDNKVYAVEVEKSSNPNWDKYTDDIRVHFDDIIWIWLKFGTKQVMTQKEVYNLGDI